MAERTPTRYLALVTPTTSSRLIASRDHAMMLLKKYTRLPRPFCLRPPRRVSYDVDVCHQRAREGAEEVVVGVDVEAVSHAACERNSGTGRTAPRPRAAARSEPEAGCW